MADGESSKSTQEPSGIGRVMKKLTAAVETTILDLDACRDVVSRMVTDGETKARDQKFLRTSPDDVRLTQPIDSYRLAAPCDSDWSDLVGTDRCRFCSQCGLSVYDAAGIGADELNQAIFQKENKENYVLYKRKDGRFLTSNCPVGQKRIRSGILTIACLTLVLAGVIAVACWLGMNNNGRQSQTVTQSSNSLNKYPARQSKTNAVRESSSTPRLPWLPSNSTPKEAPAYADLRAIGDKIHHDHPIKFLAPPPGNMNASSPMQSGDESSQYAQYRDSYRSRGK